MKKRFKKITAAVSILTLICVFVLSGCDTPMPSETDEPDTKPSVSTGISGGTIIISDTDDETSEPSDYPVTINDTVIKARPSAAVCLSSGLSEIICELGYEDRLIGRGSYCDYPESIKALTDFGRPAAPDIAALKSCAPDVLITATAIPNIDVKALNEYGIEVVYIPSPRTVLEFERIYCALGMIFDGMFKGGEKGKNVFAGIRNKLENSGIDLGSFIYVTEGFTTAGGDTFESSVLSLFGNNAAESVSGYYSGELGDISPDTVLINAELSFEDIADNSVFAALEAVRSGKVIKIDNRYFESPSGRIIGLLDDLNGTGGNR